MKRGGEDFACEVPVQSEFVQELMLKYMAGVRWQDRRSSIEVVEMCGIKDHSVELRKRKPRWFRHVKRAAGRVLNKVEEVQDSTQELDQDVEEVIRLAKIK
ncbi:hypothetical protein E2C01_025353 [Portunus trituberculatus]|uniref:Uncharacterized protein n=1 Tax=Portunus trituberculatus TaxID=210409 RepID=A0A5B7ED25_PORTR|nr:hypothetical protein [Portunus trituberculatus]